MGIGIETIGWIMLGFFISMLLSFVSVLLYAVAKGEIQQAEMVEDDFEDDIHELWDPANPLCILDSYHHHHH